MDDGWSLHEREPKKADAPEPPVAPGAWQAHAPPAQWEGGAAPTLTADDKNMAMLTHLLSFAGLIVPLGNLLGPLVMWLVKKESSSFVDHHGKDAINFNISILIYTIASAVLILLIIGLFLLVAVAIFWIVMTIVQAMKASNGEWTKYPLTIEFLK